MAVRSILHLRWAEPAGDRVDGTDRSPLVDFCRSTTPAWELSSRGAYLDLTGTERLYGPGLDGAAHVSRQALGKGGIVSAGAAPSRLAAGLASLTAARAGGGVLAVVPDQVAAFLQPFPVDSLPERRSVVDRLQQLGVRTLGDLQVIPRSLLRSVFGRGGPRLAEEARGQATAHGNEELGRLPKDSRDLELVVGVRLARPVTSESLVSALLRGLAVRALTLCAGGPASRGRWRLSGRFAAGTRETSWAPGPEATGWHSWLSLVGVLWKRLPRRRQGLLGLELWAESLGPGLSSGQRSLFPGDEADCRLAEVLRLVRRKSPPGLGPGSEDLLGAVGPCWYGPGCGMSKPGQGFG